MNTKIKIDNLLTFVPPWFHIKIGESDLVEEIQREISNIKDVQLLVIDGNKCKTKDLLLLEFSEKLKFPSYFGNNWDAFDECMSDLEWLPANNYVLIIKNAINILSDDVEELDVFLNLLNKLTKYLSGRNSEHNAGQSASFHVVFLCDKYDRQKLFERLQKLEKIEII